MSMPSCYKKRGGVRGGATHIHKRKLSSEPHVKKGYKLGNHLFYTPDEPWLKLFIRKLTWPTVANILATLPPISPFLDYLSCPLVYVFISTFCFLLVNLAVFDVLGVHSSFQSLEFSITFLRKQRMKMT